MSANVDGRYPHYLRPLAERERPDRVICVDPYSTVTAGSADGSARTEQFAGWSAVCLRSHQGRLAVIHRSCGQHIGGFWRDLAQELRRAGALWVLSWQCTRAWSLMGLWTELESGRVRVSGGDYRAVKDPDQYGRQARPGLLVAEDPPCLAQLRVGCHPGQALWLDCRNWGIDLDDGIERGKAVAERLAALVTRLDAVSADSLGVPLAPTAAGQSWRGWRATAGQRGVHCHSHPGALALERAGHIGGRCECFQMGRLPYKAYHLDFRSHYGSIMCDENFPVRLDHYTASPDKAQAAEAAVKECAIARVTIQTDEAAYPYHRDGDVIYPVGKFTTVLCGRELWDAWRHGRIAAWHELAVYDLEPALLAFAAKAYRERQVADEQRDRELSSWAKSLVNALPGKLGYKLRCWETVPGALAPEPWGEWYGLKSGGGLERWRALAGVCQREVVGGYGPDAVPAMAAWITSHGRYRLLDAIRIAGRENVAYVDTDALIVFERGLLNLAEAGKVKDGALGRLEMRAAGKEFEVLGIKHYREGEVIRCAGHARGVETQSTDGKGQWYTPAASDGARLRGEQGRESVLREWPRAAPYRHGVVGPDGVVSPIIIK